MQISLPRHVQNLQEYLLQPNERNEDLALAYFRHLYGEKFKRQTDAALADGYVAGHFVLELKGNSNDWFAALLQGLAYERKQLAFSIVVVCAKGFLAAWRKEDIPEAVRSDILVATGAPSTVGRKYAIKYAERKKLILRKAIWYRPELSGELFLRTTAAFVEAIKNFETTLREERVVRQSVTLRNFTSALGEMKEFFDTAAPIKAVRAFYSMIYGPWDDTSVLTISQRHDDRATLGGVEVTSLVPSKRHKFKQFVDNRAICIKDDESIDDFFAKYDEALDTVDKSFRIKNGIFFTDLYLSKFTMWMVKQKIPNLGRNYLVVDPACGSGNLVTNWRSPLELRHKVVSEIEPELLYAVEQRMKGDQWHNGKFTVVPKVSENTGLNFLDKSAEEYIRILKRYLAEKGQRPDKPIAFLCNPPYRCDDDQTAEAVGYKIDPRIADLTGNDAASERYCCFLAQMKLICQAAADSGMPEDSVLMLFTKAAWLTNRPVFQQIRRQILGAYEDIGGVLVNGKEFFDVQGSFPVAFTMWRFKGESQGLDADRAIPLIDLTWVKKQSLLNVNWADHESTNLACQEIMASKKAIPVFLGEARPNIRLGYGLKISAEFKRNRRKSEPADSPAGGLPKGDHRNANKKAYGETQGQGIGFMDDLTPCRVGKANQAAPYFYLESRFMRVRSFRCFSGPPDKYAYVGTTPELAEKLFTWFALGRTFASCGYPMWADALELWAPQASEKVMGKMLRYAYAIGYAENECVETRFPANNPVPGAVEVFVFNPLTPLVSNSFWSVHLMPHFSPARADTPGRLVSAVDNVFRHWKSHFKTKKTLITSQPRTYFVDDGWLSAGAGLIQIKDYAAESESAELTDALEDVGAVLKATREEFYQMLTTSDELNYFGQTRPSKPPTKRPFLPKTKFDYVVEKRLGLAAILVEASINDNHFGLTKFVKLFYLADMICRLDLKTEYARQAAGPLDARALYNDKIGILPLASRHGYFEIHRPGALMKFTPKENLKTATKNAKGLFGADIRRIQSLLKLFEGLNTDQAEIIATLYACWNDLLIDDEIVTDDFVLREFLKNWHPKKTKFPRGRLVKALAWMKNKGVLPKGFGARTSALREEVELA